MHASRRETGQGLVEYALIIMLVAILVVAALLIVGGNLTGVFNSLVNSLPT
jgi:pilus assembly protein Flp/PilA